MVPTHLDSKDIFHLNFFTTFYLTHSISTGKGCGIRYKTVLKWVIRGRTPQKATHPVSVHPSCPPVGPSTIVK